jgi:hypothetical protein
VGSRHGATQFLEPNPTKDYSDICLMDSSQEGIDALVNGQNLYWIKIQACEIRLVNRPFFIPEIRPQQLQPQEFAGASQG